MEEVMKNLWLLLTVVLPGMATYGTFRLLLLFTHGRIPTSTFEKADASAVLTSCFVAAIALMQQAIAISLEAAASRICQYRREGDPYRLLFCERFKMAAAGKLNENATRIIGNVFTSLNVTIGLGLILAYLMLYEKDRHGGSVIVVAALAVAGIITTAFRLQNAKGVVSRLDGRATDATGLEQASIH